MRLDHIGLSVRDLDAMAAWYQRAFGFERTGDFAVAALGLRGTFLTGPDGLAIELLERSGSIPPERVMDAADAMLTHGWGHLCFRVANLEAEFARLVEAGATIVNPPAASPDPASRFAYVGDLEGNLIELVDRKGPVGT
ncbi:VOC family protein [Microbacterium album]|uniref:VOC domain-containing protein n=1 Tax=Microbacterium album TaxID=2053191 RepID=A0A917MJX8_9MICO|nr:VOC family protein [Microbacterium album]GGH33597.1 hypothetical protein GCM10010921_00650 [Microbacterium album]